MDHSVRLFTLSSTVSLLPHIACGLKDRITRQECPLFFFFGPCIISIYLPCSLFLYPQWLYTWRLSLPWCIPKCQPANGFLWNGNRPGPKEDLPVCIFNLKLDPSSRAEKLQVSLHMTAFVVLNVSQQLAIMIYRCWIVRVMVFSIFKDESLPLCLNVLLACFRQQLAMGGSFNRYI